MQIVATGVYAKIIYHFEALVQLTPDYGSSTYVFSNKKYFLSYVLSAHLKYKRKETHYSTLTIENFVEVNSHAQTNRCVCLTG